MYLYVHTSDHICTLPSTRICAYYLFQSDKVCAHPNGSIENSFQNAVDCKFNENLKIFTIIWSLSEEDKKFTGKGKCPGTRGCYPLQKYWVRDPTQLPDPVRTRFLDTFFCASFLITLETLQNGWPPFAAPQRDPPGIHPVHHGIQLYKRYRLVRGTGGGVAVF